jgi:ABC-type nitrate/sulfonate/bicarbonate transport system substrate-binding protein
MDVTHEYFAWQLVQDVAEEKGYFEDEGIDPDLDYFAAGTQDHEGENAYDADWWEDLDEEGETHGVCEWNAIQQASETDREIIGSYSEWDRVVFAQADSDIETVEDLKGKPVGINKYATSFYSMREMFENEGFDEDEIVLEHIGSSEERFDAVKDGEVAGIAVLEPYVTLGRFDEELQEVFEGPCKAAIVSREDPDPEKVEAFRNALNRAVEDINDDLDHYTQVYVDYVEEHASENPEAFEDVDFDDMRENLELQNFLPVREADEERIGETTEWMNEKGFVDDDDEIPLVKSEDKDKVKPSDD